MDLRWGRRRDMKKRLSIDSAGLVLFFFFFSPFSPLFPIRHLSVKKRQARVYIASTAAPRTKMGVTRSGWPRLEHLRPVPEKLLSLQHVPGKYPMLSM